MDDIDDLLDEVEREFAEKEKLSLENSHKIKKVHNKREISRRNRPQLGDDIDKEIDDILGPDDGFTNPSTKSNYGKKGFEKSENGSFSQNKNKKCFPTFLGGSAMKKGISVTGSKRACNNLRCTSCDFKVLDFENYYWHSSVDYLFFRNKMPDRSKLQVKLKKMPGTNAYCCQCSWKSIEEPTAISQFKDLKWVCGRH